MITYSFIIPHHNSPELLNRCLDSIPQREDIQIIVVDDNSEQHKKNQVVRKDVEIVYVNASESRGAGHARNVGLDKAVGKWILFADCDDYYDSTLISCLDKHKNSDIDILFFGAHSVIGSIDNFQNYGKNQLSIILEKYVNSEHTLHDIHRLGLSTNVPWNKMFRHDFITRIGARFEEIPISNDAWFANYSGSEATKIEVILDKLYYYIINPSGITMRKRPLFHYMQAMKSNKRRNLLKYNKGCIDLVSIPGFNAVNIKRDYGILVYYGLFFYKVATDGVIRRKIWRQLVRK